jgi:predicted DsbA family dithiol-disulfide isomerase
MDIPWDPQRIAAGRANFLRLANEAGLEVGERTRWYDSTAAHEAAGWAHEQGPPEREEEFRRAIFRAYFVHNQNIADPDVLVSLAQSTEPPYTPEQIADLRAALVEHRYLPAVQQQYREAREVGVTGVPTFVAGGYALVGAHPYEHFHQLMAAAGESPRAQSDGQRDGEQ